MVSEKTPLLQRVQRDDDNEDEVIYKPKERQARQMASFKQLFRFADKLDVWLLVVGTLGCLSYGALGPLQFLVMKSVTDDFVQFIHCFRSNCSSPVDLEKSMTEAALWYIGFAVMNLTFAWGGLGLWGVSAERQVHKMRLAMFRNIIHQEMAYFDVKSSGELGIHLSQDMNKVVDGLGSRFGRLIYSITAFVSGYFLGFFFLWKMTLVMLAALPLLALSVGLFAKAVGGFAAKELASYGRAGNVAEESLSSIRTVASFGGETEQTRKYDVHLSESRKFGINKGLGIGIGMGFFQVVSLAMYAIALWYGIKLVQDKEAEPGEVSSTFFMVMIGSGTLGQAAPCIEALASARVAAFKLFNIIDKRSKIDAFSDKGSRPNVKGDIEFRNVNFVYSNRPSVQVLKDFNLKVSRGKRIALVGESGCGKSTVVKLISRFYDPQDGAILLDGEELRDYNVSHLRRHIGVVNQEPVLFSTTIAENIALGAHDGISPEEIEKAARAANAHNFISQFPDGYQTQCGERGAKMSGGQKQRIAIARALVRNPKILLLDEATSALDSESEAVVQEALDRAGYGRTTIIIAHRLSTIKNADVIVTMKDGHVAEIGTHDELIALKNGIYKTLVMLQNAEDNDAFGCDGSEDENEDELRSFQLEEADGAFKLGSFTSSGSVLGLTKSLVTEEADESNDKPLSFFQIFAYNMPELCFIIFGCLGSALYGTSPTLYGICMGGIFETLTYDPNIPSQRDDMTEDSRKWALVFSTLGCVSGFGVFLQYWMFAKSGETMTQRLRKSYFLAILRQEISFFDKIENSTGALCRKLSDEVSAVQGATGTQLGFVVSTMVSVISGVLVAFINSWRLSLVMTVMAPLIFLCGVSYNAAIGSVGRRNLEQDAGQVVEETFSNMQTVALLGKEEVFFERYREAMIEPFRKGRKSAHFAGLATGSSLCIVSLTFAATFRYGAFLVVHHKITLKEMMTTVFTYLGVGVIVGQNSSMTPDYVKAKRTARNIFNFLKLSPFIDNQSEEGLKPEKCKGDIKLEYVQFRYPTRRKVKVLRNFNLHVKRGQTVALVGTSGCGKSTAVSLVQRFYDIQDGSVTLDGHDVKDLNIKWLRRQIGFVSQEPVLFDVTIRENIAYGDLTRDVSDFEIEAAAKSSNIHDFIRSLPQGYDTMVGEKGTQISGGQKQRIAIARALIRDPKILLLDEATSALDSESEKIVQEALDNARVGRTTLIIAHRLSTIQSADYIVVIRRGRILERGKHEQLMAMKGTYYTLYTVQRMSKV